MRDIIRIEGEYPIRAVVEPMPSAPSTIRLTLEFYGPTRDILSLPGSLRNSVALLLSPDETDRLAAALQAAAAEIRVKRGDEERGSS